MMQSLFICIRRAGTRCEGSSCVGSCCALRQPCFRNHDNATVRCVLEKSPQLDSFDSPFEFFEANERGKVTCSGSGWPSTIQPEKPRRYHAGTVEAGSSGGDLGTNRSKTGGEERMIPFPKISPVLPRLASLPSFGPGSQEYVGGPMMAMGNGKGAPFEIRS
jgi:hypothetical protein